MVHAWQVSMRHLQSVQGGGWKALEKPVAPREGMLPWATQWPSDQPHVIFGHDALRGLQQHENATGLDTGCLYGRALTALNLPSGKLVSVQARHQYVVGDAKIPEEPTEEPTTKARTSWWGGGSPCIIA
jgi:hypothetical protein